MRDALASDCASLPAVEVLTLDAHGGDEAVAFEKQAAQADWTIIIAPECDGILEQRYEWAARSAARIIGPQSDLLAISADKWRTYRWLGAHGLPTPKTWLADEVYREMTKGAVASAQVAMCAATHPMVIKPRDGAGSLGIVKCRDGRALADTLETCQLDRKRLLVQAWAPGRPASIALLGGPQGYVVCLPAWQYLDEDLSYRGGEIPVAEPYARRATDLAHRLAAHLAGKLCGYLGVDLVLGEASDGSQDCIIELNPRLTTSYIGLRTLSMSNLAGVMLELACGRTPPVRWRRGKVVFRPDGNVQLFPI